MIKPAFQVKDLSIRIGDFTALEDLNFSLDTGAFLSILGPNGAGKSLLVKSLLGLVSPSSGHISLLGLNPKVVPAGWIGYVPQIKTLNRNFPATAIELVLSGLQKSWPTTISDRERKVAVSLLSRVGAVQLSERSLSLLSGGEIQRVYLARCLIRQPQVLFLDEPAAGVDHLGESDMYQLLEEHRQSSKATIVVVTHDHDVARHHSTHVLLLNRRQIAFGPPAEVMKGPLLRRAFGHLDHEHPIIAEQGT